MNLNRATKLVSEHTCRKRDITHRGNSFRGSNYERTKGLEQTLIFRQFTMTDIMDQLMNLALMESLEDYPSTTDRWTMLHGRCGVGLHFRFRSDSASQYIFGVVHGAVAGIVNRTLPGFWQPEKLDS